MQAVYVPADDLTDPAPATTFAHLDATTVLSRSIAELGIYPAVDPLDSTSRMLNPLVIGLEHYGVARGVQKVLQDYKNLQVRRELGQHLGVVKKFPPHAYAGTDMGDIYRGISPLSLPRIWGRSGLAHYG